MQKRLAQHSQKLSNIKMKKLNHEKDKKHTKFKRKLETRHKISLGFFVFLVPLVVNSYWLTPATPMMTPPRARPAAVKKAIR
ncbi:hypothetical protein AGMMS50268_40420 [Spirochaetia bacterium]|nr:hypothetical protein AGMMS50268_40420 [Spirochaetia bacterium]